MRHIFLFLIHYGEFFLFVVLFIEQVGLPLPAAPFLLAAGALIGAGKFSLWGAIASAALGSMAADALWYYLGKTRGKKVLHLLCRLSFRPHTCVIRTEELFQRHGIRFLMVGKFIPGLSTLTPPMAGVTRVRVSTYLFFDAIGSFVYSGAFLLLGFVFRRQLKSIGAFLEHLGWGVWILLFALIVTYVLIHYLRNRRASP